MKVGFVFPCTEVARSVAVRLLETGVSVEFFCPEKLDVDICSNIIYELNIVGAEQDILRDVTNSFSVPSNSDLSDCDVIGNKKVHLLLHHSQSLLQTVFSFSVT